MMNLDSIKEILAEDWQKIERMIAGALGSNIEKLNAVNAILLSRSGKQLRPLLALLVSRACSGGHPAEASFRYAAAAELLHNATLLHDDVADESDSRRGMPTVRAMMGPSVSVLVGDFWLVKAMEMIIGDNDTIDMRVVRMFSKTLSDLAEGELFQLHKAETGDTDQKDYMQIIYDKTASLFEAAIVSSAISVNASKSVEEAMTQYAVSLGVAFQIRDDMLDYQQTSAHLGKPAGADVMERKITLPLLGALDNASKSSAGLAAQIREKVSDIGSHPEYRDEIIAFTLKWKGLEYAAKVLEDYIARAKEALAVLPDSQEKECLVQIADYVGNRTF